MVRKPQMIGTCFTTAAVKINMNMAYDFLFHKDSVLGFHPISSRICAIRLRASPFNITIVQVYVPTSDYDDEQAENFYNHLHEVVDQTRKKHVTTVLGDWNAKFGKNTYKD